MYGFISIENTVIVFGAGSKGTGGGEGGELRDSLSHLSQVLFSVSRSARRPIHSSDPFYADWGVKIIVPFLLVLPRLFTFPSERLTPAYVGDGVQADRSGLPCTFLSPQVLNAASVPAVRGFTSCGSRSCEWGLTPPLVSGHWWSPPTFQGTPPSGPGTLEMYRSRSLTGSPPAGQHRHTIEWETCCDCRQWGHVFGLVCLFVCEQLTVHNFGRTACFVFQWASICSGFKRWLHFWLYRSKVNVRKIPPKITLINTEGNNPISAKTQPIWF